MESPHNPHLQRILLGLNGTVLDESLRSETNNVIPVIPGLNLTRPEVSVETSQSQNREPVATNRIVPAIPDASTITTWPAALRHVSKYLTANENAATRVKRLIAQQHRHEREWWTGREAIITRQANREGNRAKAASLLRAIGGKVNEVEVDRDPQMDVKELEAYDKKVYTEQVKMAADIDRQLRALGVPFFAIKHDLVILEQGEARPDEKTRLDKGELRELQRKMLQTLEDLFGD